MTGQDLVNEVALHIPNALSAEDTLAFINKELFLAWHDICVDDVSTIDIFAGETDFTLPPQIREDTIRKLTVNGKRYMPHWFEGKVYNGWFRIKDQNITINPGPQEDGQMVISHIFYPSEITLTDDIVGLRDIGPQLLVVGAAQKISVVLGNIGKANNFRIQYNEILQQNQLNKGNKFAKMSIIKVPTKGRWRR